MREQEIKKKILTIRAYIMLRASQTTCTMGASLTPSPCRMDLLQVPRLLYAVHLFTDEIVFLHYLGTWIQVSISSKTNKLMKKKKNTQRSFCNVSLDKTPFTDSLLILLL